MSLRFLAATLALLPAALPAQTRADAEPYQRFSAAYATLDAQRVARVYTEDAVLLPPAGDMIRGRADIAERFEHSFRPVREHRGTCRISFELVNTTTAGDLRNDIGYYTIVTTDPDGHTETFRGKFLKVWQRERDGVWRVRADSYSAARRP